MYKSESAHGVLFLRIEKIVFYHFTVISSHFNVLCVNGRGLATAKRQNRRHISLMLLSWNTSETCLLLTREATGQDRCGAMSGRTKG